ncbi:MAG: DUF11 domain-containing protein [Anaerolineae bacterium]|nr:DUF11 domain-containing protein [Anaerolineae bacterium]
MSIEQNRKITQATAMMPLSPFIRFYTMVALVVGLTLSVIYLLLPANAALPIAPPALSEAPHAGLSITKTAHLSSAFSGGATCAGPTFPLTLTTPVQPNTSVIFCYRVQNTSANTYNAFTLSDTHYSEVRTGLTFAPGASLYFTSATFIITRTSTTTPTLVNAAWSAGQEPLISGSPLTVIMIAPDVTIDKTVGTSANSCANNTATTMDVPISTTVYYCYSINNTGLTTLSLVSLVDNIIPSVSVINGTIVEPGVRFMVGPYQYTIVTPTTNIVTVTASFSGTTLVVTDTVRVNVVPPTPSLSLFVSVSTNPACVATDTLTVTVGTQVYFCYTATNTGNVALTHHNLLAGGVNVMTGVPYVLAQNAMTQSIRGPITINAETVHQVFWTGFITGTGVTATGGENATVFIGTPSTATPVPGSTNTPTPTPGPSATSTPTQTPTPSGGAADLSATIVAPSTILPNAAFSYTLQVRNIGGSVASGVQFTAALPSNAIVQALSPSAGLNCANVPNPGALGGTMTCSVASGLAAGALVEFGFTVLPFQEGAVTISLTTSTSSNEPNKANNAATVVVTSQRRNLYLPLVQR